MFVFSLQHQNLNRMITSHLHVDRARQPAKSPAIDTGIHEGVPVAALEGNKVCFLLRFDTKFFFFIKFTFQIVSCLYMLYFNHCDDHVIYVIF